MLTGTKDLEVLVLLAGQLTASAHFSSFPKSFKKFWRRKLNVTVTLSLVDKFVSYHFKILGSPQLKSKSKSPWDRTLVYVLVVQMAKSAMLIPIIIIIIILRPRWPGNPQINTIPSFWHQDAISLRSYYRPRFRRSIKQNDVILIFVIKVIFESIVSCSLTCL